MCIRDSRQLRRLNMDSVLIEKPSDQQNRSDRDEDVFTEEESDVVDGGGVRPDLVSHRLRQFAVLILRRSLRHWRDEGPHHLRVSAERCETERGCDLTDGCLLYTSPSPRDRTRSRMPS